MKANIKVVKSRKYKYRENSNIFLIIINIIINEYLCFIFFKFFIYFIFLINFSIFNYL